MFELFETKTRTIGEREEEEDQDAGGGKRGKFINKKSLNLTKKKLKLVTATNLVSYFSLKEKLEASFNLDSKQ